MHNSDPDDYGRLISYTPALPEGYGSITYTWNTLGQKTSMMVPMGNDTAKKYLYHYDTEGKQIGMDTEVVAYTGSNPIFGVVGTTSDGTAGDTRFFYDDDRNRVKLVTKAGDAYYYVYDPTAAIPAVVYEAMSRSEETAGGTITIVTTYLNTRKPGGSLISREKYIDGILSTSRTYHFDGLGSTIALTDESGNTTDTYSYDAWGNVTHTSGTTDDNPYQYVGEYGYYTHYQEGYAEDGSLNFKLLQLGVRYYDPSTGRFTQEDPIKDGLNWYGYAGGNSIGGIDPWGLTSLNCERLQYDRIVEILKYEEKYGIAATLERYNNTNWSGKTRLGDFFSDTDAHEGEKNHGVNTAHGFLDLDWWVDLNREGQIEFEIGNPHRPHYDTVYRIMKSVETLNPFRIYKDPKEKAAVLALEHGYVTFKSLFPPYFMESWRQILANKQRKFDAMNEERKKKGLKPLSDDQWQTE